MGGYEEDGPPWRFAMALIGVLVFIFALQLVVGRFSTLARDVLVAGVAVIPAVLLYFQNRDANRRESADRRDERRRDLERSREARLAEREEQADRDVKAERERRRAAAARVAAATYALDAEALRLAEARIGEVVDPAKWSAFADAIAEVSLDESELVRQTASNLYSWAVREIARASSDGADGGPPDSISGYQHLPEFLAASRAALAAPNDLHGTGAER